MASIKEYLGKNGKSYNISVSCGYDSEGRQIVKRMTWHPDPGMTEAQIKKELDRQVLKFENTCKVGQSASGIRFEDFAEQWLIEYAKPNLKPNSYARMLQLRDRIYPAIGHMKVDKITRRDIRNLVNTLANAKNKKDSTKGLSRKTVKHYLSFVSDIFSYAVECDLINTNPCTRIKVPLNDENAPKEHDFYSIEEMCALYDLMEEENVLLKYKVFFNLAFFGGYRRGEILGLEWKSIDWERKTISISQTSNYTPGKGIYKGTPKTKSSNRIGCYDDKLFDLLAEHKEQQEQEKKKLGSKWKDHGLLFTKWNGEPMFPTTPYDWLYKFCKKHGFRFCNVHSFRHSHASGLIAAGLDVPTVAADLGHNNNLTTMSIYAHEFQMAQAKANDVLENGMEKARKKLSENNDKQAAVIPKNDTEAEKKKAPVRLVKVTERKNKRK
ncbi:Site-specific recombinase XerD [Ruminococcaceae bacterium FB2012]|nr:Site-specific recombinase XerD [Ruminococcaceae bacterium FB2012]